MTTASLQDAAALADAGRWAASRDAYLDLANRDGTADAHFGVARACWWLGDTRLARDHAERAFARYEEQRRHAESAQVGLHLCLWYLSNFDNPAAAQGWLSRARGAAQSSGDKAALGWVTLISGYLAHDPAQGRRLIEEAAAVARSLPDDDLATMALADLGLWHVASGDVDRGMGMLDEAMAATLSQPRGKLEVVVWSSCDMLAACSLVDDLRRATDWCRAADRFMETFGCPFLQARCRAHYGRVLVANGRWDEAERELERALSMSSDCGNAPRSEALTGLAELRLRQGLPEAALALLDGTDATPAGAVIRAFCLLELGRHGEAREGLRSELAVRSPVTPDYAGLVAAVVEVELITGRRNEAAALLSPDAPVWAARAFPRGSGLLARAAGLVAAADDDLEGARRQLAHALDVFTALDLTYEVARTELDLARLLHADDPEAAIGRARSAHARLQRLGARQLAGEAGALLRSMGVTPPPDARGTDALSRRERDVLSLLAEGLSNPDIAGRLYLSRRTVGHHVSSILHKLGLTSRAEVAAYVARRENRAGGT